VPPTVFISYSHQDEAWKERLVTHLAGLERDGRLRTWSDALIRAGQHWLPEIEAAMEDARVAVFLISPHFLASAFIHDRELPRFLERRARDGVQIVPVLLKDCLWEEEVRIAELQVRPKGGRALQSFSAAKRNTELKKIAKEILELLRGDAQPSLPGKAPEVAALRPLHQLPPPPADFTGRTADLAALRAAVETGGVTISGVRGMGGIGKTALALTLAQELAPRYPDAQIYLDLQGVSPQPLTSAQAMTHVIRTFHPDTRLPESEAEVGALYHSALHGRRALLLMDNAAGADQVRPLLPPQECLLLVTSRFFFHLPGLQVRDLDEMPADEARALLLRIAPRIGNQADRIAELCAGVPFALRQAAGTLAERPDLSPASYASRLASGKARLGLIDASLSLSYDLLPEEMACRWRALSVFPADFDPPAVAAVWSLEQEPAETVLGELVRRSLVDGDDGRYRLHDLARVFADSRCGEEERTEARRRHALYYHDVLAKADDLYLKGGANVLRGLRLIDLEWANIQTGQAWVADQPSNDRDVAELAYGYSISGIYCLTLRIRPTVQLKWLEIALKAAQQLGNRSWEARVLRNLGVAYAKLGENRSAIEFYEQDLAIAREIGDRREEGRAIGNLGLAYANLGETHPAIKLYDQGLAIAREIGDQRGEGSAIGSLGLAYANLGETPRAIALYEQQLAIARETGDRDGEARACWNLGLALQRLGKMRRSAGMMQLAVDYWREIGHPDAEKNAAHVESLRARIGAGSSDLPA
jgi:tetratricopeptide (TPR) repeat protein